MGVRSRVEGEVKRSGGRCSGRDGGKRRKREGVMEMIGRVIY